MGSVALAVAGAVSIALIVVLGIFVYPALLGRARGKWLIGLVTLLLAALFFTFDLPRAPSSVAAALAALVLAVMPALVGLLVFRLQGGSKA